MSKKKDGKPFVPFGSYLKDYYKELSSFSLYDRMRTYNLREDRAECNFTPPCQIYINVMRWSASRRDLRT